MKLHWFLPSSGDCRNVTPGRVWPRPACVARVLAQVAMTEHVGLDAVLTPVWPDG